MKAGLPVKDLQNQQVYKTFISPVIDLHRTHPLAQSLTGCGGILHFVRVKLRVGHVFLANGGHDGCWNIVLIKHTNS